MAGNTEVGTAARTAADTEVLEAPKVEPISRLDGQITHDLNNALFAILGYSELLAEDFSPDHRGDVDPEAVLRRVAGIREAAGRAQALTNELRTFSRREAAQLEVERGDTG